MKELTQDLDRAKIHIMSKHNSVFISTVLFSLHFQWDDTIPTACTNGVYLKFSPSWFKTLTLEERAGVLCHEAWHVCFEHMLRVENRDFNLWNQAADHVINLMLLAQGYELPEDGLFDPKYKGMCTEEVYRLLSTNPNKQSGSFIPDIAKPDKEEIVKTESNIKGVITRAAIASKANGDEPGTIPSDIEVMLDKLLKPKLPWFTILQRFLTDLAPEDYSYKKLNKRFFPEFYLPSLYSESLGEIAVAVDTSGSVTQKQFASFISEINGIKEHLNPKKLKVIDFDTKIKSVTTLGEEEDVSKLKFTGRGGTNIKEVLQWGLDNKPTALVIFTDGYFSIQKINPNIPVIWIIHSRSKKFNYPFGKVITYPD